MSTRQERLDRLLFEMNRMDTVPLIVGELPKLLRLAKLGGRANAERVEVLENILRSRGVIPQPPERASERALSQSSKDYMLEKNLNKKKGLDSSD